MNRYQEFLARIDSLFEEIKGRHAQEFHCQLGCHSCCKPGLTVNSLEAENIQNAIQARSQEFLAQEKSARKDRCTFLAADGACQIYEARPVVCRSHGAPLQFKDPESRDKEARRFRDVCELNFKGKALTDLPATDFVNLDTINLLLTMLNAQAFGKKEERIPLRASAILAASFSRLDK